jgi:nitrogen regulatory protein P-II 1
MLKPLTFVTWQETAESDGTCLRHQSELYRVFGLARSAVVRSGGGTRQDCLLERRLPKVDVQAASCLAVREVRANHEHIKGQTRMKKIEAIVRHHKLEDIKTALTKIGVQGMTVTEVRGFGRQKGHTETYRGAEYTIDFVPKIKVEVVVPESSARPVIDAILQTAKTGQIGDGKIFVSDLSQSIRIRTGESGDSAL